MARLTDAQLLAIWEAGVRQSPVERALTILAAAHQRPVAELAALTIGERDALLIDVHEQTFGGALDAVVVCPACGTALECVFHTTEIRYPKPLGPTAAIAIGAVEVLMRPPTSADLLRALSADHEEPAVALARACLVAPCEPHDLLLRSADFLRQAGDRLAALDPQSDIVIDCRCESCGEQPSVIFDIGAYLWAAIRDRARGLLIAVHDLASRFGWSEADILAMSETRRLAYQDLLS